jgi:hypothetical protein
MFDRPELHWTIVGPPVQQACWQLARRAGDMDKTRVREKRPSDFIIDDSGEIDGTYSVVVIITLPCLFC